MSEYYQVLPYPTLKRDGYIDSLKIEERNVPLGWVEVPEEVYAPIPDWALANNIRS